MDVVEYAIYRKLVGGSGGGDDELSELDRFIGEEGFDVINCYSTRVRNGAFYGAIVDTIILHEARNLGTRYSFNSCTATKIVFKKQLTALSTSYVFSGLPNLKLVDVLLKQNVGSDIFTNSKQFDTLILRSENVNTLSSKYSFDGTLIESGAGHIYVPRALVDSYKSSTNWSTFASQFRALEDYTVDGTIKGALDMSKI